MELKNTSKLMCSEDYKERFIAEIMQLEIRIQKLMEFIERVEKENVSHTCPLQLLRKQLEAMTTYLAILKIREKIEL